MFNIFKHSMIMAYVHMPMAKKMDNTGQHVFVEEK